MPLSCAMRYRGGDQLCRPRREMPRALPALAFPLIEVVFGEADGRRGDDVVNDSTVRHVPSGANGVDTNEIAELESRTSHLAVGYCVAGLFVSVDTEDLPEQIVTACRLDCLQRTEGHWIVEGVDAIEIRVARQEVLHHRERLVLGPLRGLLGDELDSSSLEGVLCALDALGDAGLSGLARDDRHF